MLHQRNIALAFGRAFRQAQLCDHSLPQLHLDIRPMSSSSEADVLFEEVKNKGVLTLNRPKALNSLNLSMVSKILPRLRQWESTKSLVIVKGAGGKAFCAGGDVREVTVASKNEEDTGKRFFRHEYMMNHLIGTYRIPYIALIDGITMGGGVGMSVHGKYCISTEKTLFAMPETQIGLFPDVGGTYFLPRLKKHLGVYLALCGTRLKGYELVQAGIATHYCPSEKLSKLEKALLAADISPLTSDNIECILKNYCVHPSDVKFSLESRLEQIDQIFNSDCVEEIILKLEKDGSDWAKETIATLHKMCPLSLKVSLEALKRGKSCTLGECLKMEYRLANASCDGHNFIEGVRALLIDKDQNPKWCPETIEKVTSQMVEDFFNVDPFEGDLEIEQREESLNASWKAKL